MSVFDQFTNKYSLSKTLRFELKPVGKTLDRMKEHMKYDENLQTFLKDQDIEDAYQVFKPLIDEIHEEFIVSSLESDEAKHIDFSSYLEAYKEKKDDKGERALRKQIGDLYKEGESYLRENYETGLKWDEKKSLVDQKFELRWKVGSKDGKSAKIMESPDILYAAAAKVDKEGKKMQKHLKVFDGFFTYFSGFNQNRANYYEVDEEKATAIATRIVHENLPKFCDNSMQFFGYSKKDKNEKEIKFYRKDEYLGAYKYLKKQGKTTKIKDAESGEMIEACEIEEKYFDISYFNLCLSQKQIEKYNRIIGHYNLLINLYNQARIAEEKKGERTFKKLPHFKTLYKQIGCGKSKALFSSLKYDREADIKSEDKEGQQKDEILSVEALLKLANSAGEKYFRAGVNDNVVDTVPKFITWLKENSGDWSGFYWSGRAVNTISNKYFANWHTIIERIHGNHKEYNNVATYDKKRERPIKLRDAVELKGLFDLLDKSVDVSIERWWESFFKRGVWEGQKEWQFLEEKEEWESRLKIIKKAKTPSGALMGIFYLDMELHAKNFIAGSEDILALANYKKEDNKKQIKAWMEEARSVNAMLRYFLVNENKTKGDIINGELTNIVKFF